MPEKNGSLSFAIKLGLVLAVLAAAVAVALFGFRTTAIVATVKLDKAVDAVPGSVVVHADGDIKELKSEAAGRVEWCEALDPGKGFKKGDVLMRLDTTTLDRSKKEAERNRVAARDEQRIATERNSERLVAEKRLADATRLKELGNASEEDVKAAKRALDEVETRLALANFRFQKAEDDFKSAMEEFDLALKKMSVLAPSDGAVKEVFVWPGALINAGATVATIYSNARTVIAKIGEEDISKVALGQKGEVRLLSYPRDYFKAKVTKILPIADADTQRYTVYLEVEAPLEKLVPFATGEVNIEVGARENRPMIPRRALFNENCVYVVKGGRAVKRVIEVGFRGLNLAEVAQGLAPGEQVIVEDLDLFHDGERVRVAEAKN